MDIFISRPNRFFLSFLALSLFFNLSAQKWVPTDYWGISNENFKEVFHERFDDNERNWNVEHLSLNAHFEDKGLGIKSLTDHTTHYSKTYEFNKDLGYQISTTFNFQKGGGEAGIAFGMDENSNGYMFLVAKEGRYEVIKLTNGVEKVLQDAVYPVSDGNIELCIRKYDGKWYFFINKNTCWHFNVENTPSTAVGWALKQRASIVVHDLLVQSIKISDRKGPLISLMSSTDMEKKGKQQNTIFLCNKSNLTVYGLTGDQYGVKEINIEDEDNMNIVYNIVESDGNGIKFRFNLNLIKDTTLISVSSIDNYDNVSRLKFSFVQKKAERQVATEIPSYNYPAAEEESRVFVVEPNQKVRNIAVFIGVNDYVYWDDLNNAVHDCNTVAEVFVNEYQFEPENILKIYNKDVTRQNIVDMFDSLQKVLGRNDNLILYYAGHGHYNEDAKFGYWVPNEARMEKPSDYISNNDIRGYLGAIQTRHTLVIADACFAGSLMRGEAEKELREDVSSRWVFTSGDLENVDDGPAGQNSPFAAAVIRALKTNPSSTIGANILAREVQRIMASGTTAQKPKAKPIKDIDSGGIFVFRRKI